MRYLADVINWLGLKGRVVNIADELSSSYEPSEVIKNAEKERKAVIFKVKGSSIPCVSNVIGERDVLYELLNSSSDEDAYLKIIDGLNAAGIGYSFKEEKFSDYFVSLDVRLDRLPAIKFFRKDGGRYITSSVVVASLPDNNDFYNASIHRLMLVPGRGLAIRLVPRHLYRIYTENLSKGLETPIAIMVGCDPLLLLSAATSPPYGVFEFSVYEKLLGGKTSIVRTPKYGIPVHPSASVVMEGKITKELVDEGPFVDLLNLYDSIRKQPLVKIESLYVNVGKPFFHVILPGGNEHKILMGFPKEAAIWDAVRRSVPKVRKVRLTNSGGGWLHAIVSISKNTDGDGKTAIMAAFAAHPSLKHVVVVDDDIDPDDISSVEWAIATRFQAAKGLVVINYARGSTLDPSSADGLTSKLGIDATYPVKEREKFMKPEW